MKKDKKKDSSIFSGPKSDLMWSYIDNANSKRRLRTALYFMGCKCQELESKVKALEKRLY